MDWSKELERNIICDCLCYIFRAVMLALRGIALELCYDHWDYASSPVCASYMLELINAYFLTGYGKHNLCAAI